MNDRVYTCTTIQGYSIYTHVTIAYTNLVICVSPQKYIVHTHTHGNGGGGWSHQVGISTAEGVLGTLAAIGLRGVGPVLNIITVGEQFWFESRAGGHELVQT